MSGQTVIEKLISNHTGKKVCRNEIAIVEVDGIMASDTTAPLAIKAFEEMGGTRVWDRDKMFLVIDHASPAPNERIANLHDMMRRFSREQGVKLYDVGEGICHQLMIEKHHVKPGQIFFGADSHTCTYGAIGAFGTGVGSTDLAGIMLTGKTWVKVPDTLKIVLNNTLRPYVSTKDLILFLAGQLGIEGATYKSIEFTGDALMPLSVDSRITISNMVIEMGAKAGFVDTAGLQLPYNFDSVKPDDDAEYEAVYEYDVSKLEPMIALPHSPDNVKPISEVGSVPIQQAFIGSCTNGKLEDLRQAAKILKGKKIDPRVRLMVTPASKEVYHQALLDGTAEILMAAGATLLPSGCGPCVGTHLGIPGNGENVLSSTNRNFQGRMGNRNANVYLASPVTVAASALTGQITHPQNIR
ncbi:3-isopropylmalate dehydratase large subunit [Ferviditalea candida]|uniref:3-isopropylmalate dehydratase large subunit n=1 Tax=Ferviditalea candida TaxID=3108399 RepID=A0ABU5ZGN0_9BACL|nr:3-isopropylmalate dehydratase large subunit [Paenibacillaceae bacterium T2]